jgi:DNA replication and repair protein RecF
MEEMMVAEAVCIHERRKQFTDELIPIFTAFHSAIVGGGEEVSLRYRSHLDENDLAALLVASRQEDRRLGYTSKGIHRDELVMQLNGFPIKKEGSQGQNKSYLVSLKLAQFDFLRRKGGETPLLLLDDIFDKLDSYRVEQIISLVSGENFGQIFITDVNREHIDGILDKINGEYKLFEVKRGEATLVKSRE